MPRDDGDRRDRSRSRGRAGGGAGGGPGPRREAVADAARSGGSEQEIVSVAIRQLPADIRKRLEGLFEEGLLKEGDLDLRSVTVFASLNEGLQARVMNHMESERIYVANARSKSGFLIATCDKAKTGCLDARGLGAIDPWMTALVAMATPKQKMIDLKPEQDWLDEKEGDPISILVNVADAENEVGQAQVTVELPLSETSAAVAAKLQAMGIKSIPINRMKLHHGIVGFLKPSRSFAFYNLEDGVTLTLSSRQRAGAKFKKDHAVMPKRPRTYEKMKEAAAKAAAAAATALPSLPGLPSMPKLPGLLGLPGQGGTAPGAGAGTAPAGLLGLPGMLGMPQFGKAAGLPSLPGLLGLPGMPPLGKAGLPGLPPPGADPKAAAMAALAGSMPGLGLGLTLPGLPPPGADPRAAAMAMLAKGGGLPAGPPGLGGLPRPGMAASGSTPKGGGAMAP